MNYKAYDKYKDSGIDWLGEIPEGWEVRRFGDFYKSRMGRQFLQISYLKMEKCQFYQQPKKIIYLAT